MLKLAPPSSLKFRRLLSFLQASTAGNSSEILHKLMRQVEGFAGNAPQHDDMTCVIVRWQSTAGSEPKETA